MINHALGMPSTVRPAPTLASVMETLAAFVVVAGRDNGPNFLQYFPISNIVAPRLTVTLLMVLF
jgi:hypothetical protein